MSKALELKTYPRLREEPNPVHDGWDAWRDWDNQIRDEYRIRAGKRFTEAELSAEYWRAGWIAESERSKQADEVARTFYRFAIRPHYWEVDE